MFGNKLEFHKLIKLVLLIQLKFTAHNYL